MRICLLFLIGWLGVSQLFWLPVGVYAASPDLTQARLATVAIVAYDRHDEPLAQGSGSLVTAEGLVLTNYHVIAENQQREGRVAVWVPHTSAASREEDFTLYWGRVIVQASDPAADLALVQIDQTADNNPLPPTATFPTFTLGDSDQLLPDEEIHILGYPEIARGSLVSTHGQIAGFGEQAGLRWILTAALIASGSSGGAVVNAQGELVAVPTMTRTDEKTGNTMGFLLPIKLAQPLIEQARQQQTDALPFHDDFSSNQSKWPFGPFANQYATGRIRLARSALQISATFKQDAIAHIGVPELVVDDFILHVEAQIIKSSHPQTGVALLFRNDEDDHFYMVRFRQDDSYALVVNQHGEWEILKEGQARGRFDLADGLKNEFTLGVKGRTLIVYANGEELTSVEDATIQAPGQIVLGVEGPAGAQAAVAFDNLAIHVWENSGEETVLLAEEFVSNKNRWPIGKVVTDRYVGEGRLVAGQFVNQVQCQQPATHYVTIPQADAENFRFSVDVALTDLVGDQGWVALGFHTTQDQSYSVRFNSWGSYIVEIYDGRWHPLQDWTASAAIRLEPGEPNTFGVVADGSLYTIYANGEELTTVEGETAAPTGEFAIGAGCTADGEITATFDNLVITTTDFQE